uniref:Methyltransferase C9orf114 n=1 Tax=Rhabditophanes sp. KR3021 TaxID=114890 RepID=A0AC35UD16_9BILA
MKTTEKLSREEHRKATKLIKGKAIEKTWRKKHNDRNTKKEEDLVKQFEDYQQIKKDKAGAKMQYGVDTSKFIGPHYRPYHLTIAIPGSIMNNAQCPELMAYLASQVARAAALHCVDRVVIYDETSQMDENQVKGYFAGDWTGDDYVSEDNIECNFHLARILEYIECPQYLRKALFPMQKPLKFAGLMNPLDGKHHLRAEDFSLPYREAVILKEPKKEGKGEVCDVGLSKKLILNEQCYLPKNTRITVKIDNFEDEQKRYTGTLTSARAVREESGLYWGFNVEVAKCLSDVLKGTYDTKIAVGVEGKKPNQVHLNINKKSTTKILVVYGGLSGLETALNSDDNLTSKDPNQLFDNVVECLPVNGSNSLRTEEALLISMTELRNKFDRVF